MILLPESFMNIHVTPVNDFIGYQREVIVQYMTAGVTCSKINSSGLQISIYCFLTIFISFTLIWVPNVPLAGH